MKSFQGIEEASLSDSQVWILLLLLLSPLSFPGWWLWFGFLLNPVADSVVLLWCALRSLGNSPSQLKHMWKLFTTFLYI